MKNKIAFLGDTGYYYHVCTELMEAFKRLNYDVEYFRNPIPELRSLPMLPEHKQKIQFLKDYDLVIVDDLGSAACIVAEATKLTKTVLFLHQTEEAYEMGGYYDRIIGKALECDYVAVMTRDKWKKLEDNEIFPLFLPYGYDLTEYHPVTLSDVEVEKYRSDVCFVGRITPQSHLSPEIKILNRGELVKIFQDKMGERFKWWQNVQPPIPNAVYNASKICLNSGQLPARVFQILGAGGFLLTSWSEEIEELFNVGDELVAFKSLSEAVELAEYYLEEEHEQERLEIAEKGHKVAEVEHTFEKRCEQLLEMVELK